MYRVLLPLDDTMERARRQANYAVSLPKAAEEVLAFVTHAMTATERSAPNDIQRVDRIKTVRRVNNILEEAGVEHEVRELPSPPGENIVELAESEDVDEVVMGGPKRSPAEKVLLGSVTQTVIMNADVPVVVTGG